MKNIALFVSVILNLLFIVGFWFLGLKILEGSAEIPNGRIGFLNKDVSVGVFNSNSNLFTLPKGLVVREASASGAGWLEPNRFRLVITSANEDLVNYVDIDKEELINDSEFYSADNVNNNN